MPAHWGTRLADIMASKDISLNLNQNLVEIDKKNRVAIFKDQVEKDKFHKVPFDLLHVGPPMKVPDGVRNSKVCDASGLVPVN